MIFFTLKFILDDGISLLSLLQIFLFHLVVAFLVDQLHLQATLLRLFFLDFSKLGRSLLFQFTSGLDDLLLFFAALPVDLYELQSVILCLLQVLLVFLMFNRALDQLIFETILFVLLSDQLASESLVSDPHVGNVLLVDLSQENCLLREHVYHGPRGLHDTLTDNLLVILLTQSFS